MPNYFIMRPVPYSTKCNNSSYTIYTLDRIPESGSSLDGKIKTLVKKRFYDCDEILYAILKPNTTDYPYFRITETAQLLTYLSSLNFTIDIELTNLTRSQYKHAYVFY